MTNEELKRHCESKGIDWEFSQEILAAINGGKLTAPEVRVADFPPIDGQQILDLRTDRPFVFSDSRVKDYFALYFPQLHFQEYLVPDGKGFSLSSDKAAELGLILSQKTAVGILNGGMATSYGDSKKNQALGQEIYQIFQSDLVKFADLYQGQPKGVTASFIQPTGEPGYSYMELKLRHMALVNHAAQMQGIQGPGLKLFQMTSQATDGMICQALNEYTCSPLLKDFQKSSPWKYAETLTAVQSLVGTFTPPDAQGQRSLFIKDFGKGSGPELYALPGGHGQNFRVLKSIYQQLHREGYQFVYLGNVDNLGFLTSLKSLTLLALSGAPAAFDFSFKTPVDIKGGVLYRTPEGQLNCADIGVAISSQKIQEAERNGAPILFNCATGLFHLPSLLDQIDQIIKQLPIRLSEQDKDMGRYAQAEQVTWEVIGLLDRPLIFGIEKNKRFLAAKLLIDCLMTSGLHWQDPRFQTEALKPLAEMGRTLNQGLHHLLAGPYGLRQVEQRWVPLTQLEVEQKLRLEGIGFLSV